MANSSRSAAYLAVLASVFAVFVGSGSALAQSGQRTQDQFELNRLRAQNSSARYSSSLYINQARRQGVDVGGGFGAGVRAPLSFDNRRSAGFGNRRTPSRPAQRPVQRPAQRPFSNISRRPSVSPYLGLFTESFDENANALAYQTLVRPQQRQQRFNEQVRREAAQMNSRLQSIAAQSAFNATGNQNLAPTGVAPGAFRYFSHYYPSAR
ncbi:MAG: hypothetical protein AAGB00_03800 [Planctomycetota bacterium]